MWEKIEKLLKEKTMTKNKLATLAGINKNSLIDLKMGRKKSLKFGDVVKIADALDISLDEFRKGWGVLTKKQRLREQFLEPTKAFCVKEGQNFGNFLYYTFSF